MLEGLAEVGAALAERGIAFVIRHGAPERSRGVCPGRRVIVCDRGYLEPKSVAREVGRQITCRLVQVEGDVVVPVETASPKHEVGARTLRPKLTGYGTPTSPADAAAGAPPGRRPRFASDFDLTDVPSLVRSLKVDRPSPRCAASRRTARLRGSALLAEPFARYAKNRSVPEAGAASHMSPYLHFGQISPVEIALAIREARTGDDEDRSAYLEELIVRRELAMNHVFYDERYDAYETGPNGPARPWTAGAATCGLSLHARATRSGRNPRPLLECGHAGDAGDRLHAQPHAHVLGQEDPGVVALARRGI